MTTKMPPTKASRRRNPPKDPTTLPAKILDRPRAEDSVTLAVVAGAHGIGGQVRLKSFSDNLSAYSRFNEGRLTLRSLSSGGIATFAEIADRNAAEALRGTKLTIARTELPALDDGEYYHADLLGLAVVSSTGEPVGRVVAIDDFGAGDVIEIERAGLDGGAGKRFMVPMTREAVPEWNGERLIVDAAFVE